MMKKLSILAASFLVLFVVIGRVEAKKDVLARTDVAQTQSQNQQKPSLVPTGNQERNENRVQTQNQGEEQQVQVQNQEEEKEGEDNRQGNALGIPKKTSSRSENAYEHMSVVAQKVEELLTARTVQGGIGEQVRQIAQEQKQSQEQVQEQLVKIDSRQGLLKIIVGPDYKNLGELKKQLEQNQLRIQLLEKLKNQLSSQSEITLVQEMIQALTEQNTALQERITQEYQTGSVLGWFFKLLSK